MTMVFVLIAWVVLQVWVLAALRRAPDLSGASGAP